MLRWENKMAKLINENMFELDDGRVACFVFGQKYALKDGRVGEYTGCCGSDIELSIGAGSAGGVYIITVTAEDVEDTDIVTFKSEHRKFSYEN
jgi:hypothetical protein